LIVRRAICCSSSVAALFKYVHEQVVTVLANAANFGSSCAAALSNSGFGATTISDDGLT
jgi:hypothetical protein